MRSSEAPAVAACSNSPAAQDALSLVPPVAFASILAQAKLSDARPSASLVRGFNVVQDDTRDVVLEPPQTQLQCAQGNTAAIHAKLLVSAQNARNIRHQNAVGVQQSMALYAVSQQGTENYCARIAAQQHQ